MAHNPTFRVRLRDRGRIVVPALIRRQLKLQPREELLISVQDDGSLRILSARQLVRQTRGLYRVRGRKRSLADELIADRRRKPFARAE